MASKRGRRRQCCFGNTLVCITVVLLFTPATTRPDERSTTHPPDTATGGVTLAPGSDVEIYGTSIKHSKGVTSPLSLNNITPDPTTFHNTTDEHDVINSTTTEDPQYAILMQLLADEYYKTVTMGRVCLEQMHRDGYNATLSISHRICVCFLTMCEQFGYELDEEQKQILADLTRKVDDETKESTLKWKYSAEKLPELIGISTSYLLIFVTGTIGNILVLVTVFRHMGRPTVTNIMIASISVGDLMILTIVLPLQLSNVLYGYWELGDVMCKITIYLYFTSFASSTLSLLIMSVERYIVICHPMKAQSVSTIGRAKKIVASIWCVSLLVAIPIIPISYVDRNMCVVNHLWMTYTFTMYAMTVGLVFVLPLLVMMWAYISVSVALWKSIKLSKSLRNKPKSLELHNCGENGVDTGTKKKKKKKEDEDSKATERLKVIKMLVSLVVVFAVCWGPYWGVRLRRAYTLDITNESHKGSLYRKLELIFQVFAYLNSAVNPILYAFISRPFRRGFKRACACGKSDNLPADLSTSARTYTTSDVNPSTST